MQMGETVIRFAYATTVVRHGALFAATGPDFSGPYRRLGDQEREEVLASLGSAAVAGYRFVAESVAPSTVLFFLDGAPYAAYLPGHPLTALEAESVEEMPYGS